MKRAITALPLLWVVLIAGCGGGGGGGVNNPPPLDGSVSVSDATAIQSRHKGFWESIVAEDLESAMSFFAEDYRASNGTGKAGEREAFRQLVSEFDFLSVQSVQDSFTQGAGYIRHDYTVAFTARRTATNQQGAGNLNGFYHWINRGGVWFIYYSDTIDNTAQSLRRVSERDAAHGSH